MVQREGAVLLENGELGLPFYRLSTPFQVIFVGILRSGCKFDFGARVRNQVIPLQVSGFNESRYRISRCLCLRTSVRTLLSAINASP